MAAAGSASALTGDQAAEDRRRIRPTLEVDALLSAARQLSRDVAARAAEFDRDGTLPTEDVGDLRREGLLRAPLPREHGGLGLGTTATHLTAAVNLLRIIGHSSLPLGRLYEGHVNALRLIARHGRAEQVARFAAEVRSGRLLGVWNTDDRQGLQLVAAGRGLWRLEGRKILASGAGMIERPLVTARSEDGARLMLLPELSDASRAELSAWTPHGMRASATGAVDFTGVQVSSAEILGGAGDYQRQPSFSAGAWRFAAVQLGGIEALLDLLREHLRTTGRGTDPHQQMRVGEAALAAEAARLWVERAARVAEDERLEADAVVAYVNLARTAVERSGLAMLELVHRSVGLASFMRPHPIERISRDLATYLRQPAPDRAITNAAEYVLRREEPSIELWP